MIMRKKHYHTKSNFTLTNSSKMKSKMSMVVITIMRKKSFPLRMWLHKINEGCGGTWSPLRAVGLQPEGALRQRAAANQGGFWEKAPNNSNTCMSYSSISLSVPSS